MPPNNRMGAIRSSSFMHIDEDVRTALDEAAKDTRTQTEDEELRALQKIATLSNHPGWLLIKEQFEADIDEYRSGRKLNEFLKDYSLTDAQIGQATRVTNLVADELTRVLNAVVLAVAEVERHKEEERNATSIRRMGSRAPKES